MKYRFQLNGTIEVSTSTLRDVQEYFANTLEPTCKLTGVSVFEVPERIVKPKVGRKKRQYIRLADRDKK